MSTLSYSQIGAPMHSNKDDVLKGNQQRSSPQQLANYMPNDASPASLVHFYHEINKAPTHCQSDLVQMAPVKQMQLI